MSDKIIKDKMVETLANSILNQLNINGLIEAAKSYSIQLANKQLEEMSDEDKDKLIEHIEKADAEMLGNSKAAKESKEVEETEAVSS
jgi:succinate dehydrogenase flavin-adding protein (antitoxin of CptAB toxin-antitoxin module)